MAGKRDFLEAFKAYAGYSPYGAQQEAVFHDGGPLWILAGPGTGKSEVLVLRALRLMLLDEVPPEAIVLTTFTEKAARNLHDRLSNYLLGLSRHEAFRRVKKPDLSRIWLGTLHSLAHAILLEMDEASEDLELLDDSASFFLFLKSLKGKHTYGDDADALYKALNGVAPVPYLGRLGRAGGLVTAVERIVEDDIDANAFRDGRPLRGALEHWPAGTREAFLELVDGYEERLGRRADFARVQRRFLNFLESPGAQPFLRGDAARKLSGVRHVIVDEYQDTNPIQEAIYFALAKASKNLTVVGDDDQALYRFRGASVDAMVEFRERARSALGVRSVAMVSLDENRRSHAKIVEAVNAYLGAVARTQRFARARTPKSDLKAKAAVAGRHEPVSVLVCDEEKDCAKAVAETVAELQARGEIEDLRQVALLASSTRAIGRSPFRHYVAAFEEARVPLFNPRSKDLHKDERLMAVLGALALILDPDGTYQSGRMETTRGRLLEALKELPGGGPLRRWVTAQARRMAKTLVLPGESRFLDWSILDLFYRIVAFEPFRWEVDAVGGPQAALLSWRLAQLSGLIAGFEAAQGAANIPRVTEQSRSWFHTMRKSPPTHLLGVDCWYAYNFGRDLLESFIQGGFDDAEDEIVSFPAGMVPALTIHQAKGLEFSIVFACAIQENRGPGASHHQEDLLANYRRRAAAGSFTAEERAAHDAIRQYLVAFSRAKYGLVLCLQEAVYEGILGGGPIAAKYPHLPADWLRKLPRVSR